MKSVFVLLVAAGSALSSPLAALTQRADSDVCPTHNCGFNATLVPSLKPYYNESSLEHDNNGTCALKCHKDQKCQMYANATGICQLFDFGPQVVNRTAEAKFMFFDRCCNSSALNSSSTTTPSMAALATSELPVARLLADGSASTTCADQTSSTLPASETTILSSSMATTEGSTSSSLIQGSSVSHSNPSTIAPTSTTATTSPRTESVTLSATKQSSAVHSTSSPTGRSTTSTSRVVTSTTAERKIPTTTQLANSQTTKTTTPSRTTTIRRTTTTTRKTTSSSKTTTTRKTTTTHKTTTTRKSTTTHAPAPTTTMTAQASKNLVCGVRGYDGQNPGAFFFDGGGKADTYAACKKECTAKGAKSFAYGFMACMCYNKVLNGNFVNDKESPYVFYDMACAAATNPPKGGVY